MAIYHASMKPISRANGRSAVAAAAYRAGVRLTNERDGITHDFTNKRGVAHAEVVLPEGVTAEWALDRSVLWNAADQAEGRKDARVAREFEVALPHELSSEQRLSLVREFAQYLADRQGAAVDFAVHIPHEKSDVRNHHAHLLMTTRTVTADGLGDKTMIERENKWLLANDLPTSQMQLRNVRQVWEELANTHLARAGLDIRIDRRSHQERGLELAPTEHVGVHATQIERRGETMERARLEKEASRRNADMIREKPEQVLTLITNEKSVFDRHDIARTLHRYINDDLQGFQNAFASIMASPGLVELQAEKSDPATGEIELARYSTREMIVVETDMARAAGRLHEDRSHHVDPRHRQAMFDGPDRALRSQDLNEAVARTEIGQDAGAVSARPILPRLSDEQKNAVDHVTGPERIAAVVGLAGAGKSTMLAVAREVWQAQGYRVHGAALSGKAAEGLEEASGIESRTLAAWEYRWGLRSDGASDVLYRNDGGRRDLLGRGDVFVIDEAGMVGSRQLGRFIKEAEARGAKIVLVGDHEQLQAIGAGAPFRAIAEQIGHSELSQVRRQRVDWQRAASVSFARHRTGEGLSAYRERGDIHFSLTRAEAMGDMVRDYLADRLARPDGSRVAMAHRRVDVRAFNDAVRGELQNQGVLPKGEAGGEVLLQTNDGKRTFAIGDRIVFLQNDRDLGVKNGMLGTVESIERNSMRVQLDGKSNDMAGLIHVDTDRYRHFDHGYATTIHKNQGATVDRAFVLASATMDRHLTYVAMTRHRDGVQLYAGQEEFANRRAGRLVEHGAAPYEDDPGNRGSYFVSLENARGERHVTWGVDLGRAIAEAGAVIGDEIALKHMGSATVRLPDGRTAERNSWTVEKGSDLAFEQMTQRLGRSGVKETTLDYLDEFADRRGISDGQDADASRIGRRNYAATVIADPASEIARSDRRGDRRPNVHEGSEFNREGSIAERGDSLLPSETENALQQPQPRRSIFAGLKLSRSSEETQSDRAIAAEEKRGLDRLAERLRQHRHDREHHGVGVSGLDRRAGRAVEQAETKRPVKRTAKVEEVRRIDEHQRGQKQQQISRGRGHEFER